MLEEMGILGDVRDTGAIDMVEKSVVSEPEPGLLEEQPF